MCEISREIIQQRHQKELRSAIKILVIYAKLNLCFVKKTIDRYQAKENIIEPFISRNAQCFNDAFHQKSQIEKYFTTEKR